MVTFRLADSLPADVTTRLSDELDTREGDSTYRRRIEAYLDAGHGSCILQQDWAAQFVESSLLHFDEKRYRLHRWVIMPNHVHVLINMLDDYLLQDTIQSWKSFTARQINDRLGQKGSVWQPEYWDRYIRDQRHYEVAVSYINEKPVKANLSTTPEVWRWSSAWLLANSE